MEQTTEKQEDTQKANKSISENRQNSNRSITSNTLKSKIDLKFIIQKCIQQRSKFEILPVQDMAKYLIKIELSMNDFLYDIEEVYKNQNYFMKNVIDLYDIVIGLMLEEIELLKDYVHDVQKR